jgi:hypothetical protein
MGELFVDKDKKVKARTFAVGSNEQVIDTTVAWANSDAAGTTKTVDVTLPDELQGDAKYLVIVTNPSTETTLTVKTQNKETFGSAKYPEVASIAIPANTPEGKGTIVEGWLLGEAGRLVLSNDTAIGLTGAFTAEVRVRKL